MQLFSRLCAYCRGLPLPVLLPTGYILASCLFLISEAVYTKAQCDFILVSYCCNKIPQNHGLNQNNTILQFLKSEVGFMEAKLYVSRARLLPETRGESPCLFQFLEATCIPWLAAPSSIFKASNVTLPNLLDPLLPLSYCYLFLLTYGTMAKDPPANAGDASLIPRRGRSPGGRNGNPLQYSCLGTSMDRGAWQATAKSQT